ncbi:MAG: hypothetical protein ABIG63_12135 [Chloroflexota bacterium]
MLIVLLVRFSQLAPENWLLLANQEIASAVKLPRTGGFGNPGYVALFSETPSYRELLPFPQVSSQL